MFQLMKGRVSFWKVAGTVIFMILQVLTTLYLPNLTADIVNNGITKGDTHYIIIASGKMLLTSILVVLASFSNVFLAAQVSQKLGQKLRTDIYQKVLYMSNDEFDQVGTSSLITRTTNDVLQVQNVVMMLLRMMIMAPIMMIGASLMAYQKNAQLTQVFLIVIPILAIVLGIIMYWAVPLFKAMQQKTDRLNLIFREGLTGVRVIRAFRQDQYEQKRFGQANQDYTHNAEKVYSIVAAMPPIMTLIMGGTNIGITWLGAHYIAQQSLQVGNLIAFMTYAMQILMSCTMLAVVFVVVPRAQASAARIRGVLDLQSQLQEPKTSSPNPSSRASLEFRKVGFRYQQAEKSVLTGVNFQAQAGQTVGIIGGTGSGKTTLVSLISRMYDVTTGAVLVNGSDVRQQTLTEINTQVAVAFQKAILFKGSLRENLQYGNSEATDEQLWHALAIAQAQDFVQAAQGLETWVEQDGSNFSGGQRQRLTIARALVKEAAIYVFDDSFSALDFQTDARLRQALRQDPRMKTKIIVIVGQRISTIADADTILVLDQGQMVGCGTHAELKAKNATYQEIMQSQIKGGVN
ncbi:ABC transporter ATP-binding protein [Lactobacillus sp. DCY120]|uniref:ABC transporter ATP-binding protein n=1 Tax=Bombilactobacillus apium TaxID=2675299 RepID=A0A850R9X2_9LACO|nr:ABC transporter ATP-binding protein [Bombilactobacillus apium]NVY95628.1 ABC transporter ATP-binding protein [Bombilactobacillus apium]